MSKEEDTSQDGPSHSANINLHINSQEYIDVSSSYKRVENSVNSILELIQKITEENRETRRDIDTLFREFNNLSNNALNSNQQTSTDNSNANRSSSDRSQNLNYGNGDDDYNDDGRNNSNSHNVQNNCNYSQCSNDTMAQIKLQ